MCAIDFSACFRKYVHKGPFKIKQVICDDTYLLKKNIIMYNCYNIIQCISLIIFVKMYELLTRRPSYAIDKNCVTLQCALQIAILIKLPRINRFFYTIIVLSKM